jgi:hypothetical protein
MGDMVKLIVRADGTRVLSLRGTWSDEAEAAVADGRFDILSIQAGNWGDFSFLAPHAGTIKRLLIAGGVESYRGLEKLTELTEIDLEEAPGQALDLLAFQKLEKCYLRWHKKYPKAFFALPRLAEVTLANYPGKDCADIGMAAGLRKLDLRKGSVTSLSGLEQATGLQHLSLAYTKELQDISAVAKSPLQVLHLEKCPKLAEIDLIRGLTKMRELFVDCASPGFADLRWLGRMENLADVLIAVPVQQIDWSILFAMPALQRVVINTHEGYGLDEEALLACAKAYGRQVDGLTRAGTKAHPAVKFWMTPKAV